MTFGSRRTETATTAESSTLGEGSATGDIPAIATGAWVRWRHLPAILATAFLILVPSAGSAAAQQSEAVPPAPTIRIVTQTNYVASDGAIAAELELSGPTVDGDGDALELAVTVFGLIEDSEELRPEPATTEPLNRQPSIPLDELATGIPGRYRIELPIRSGPPLDDDRALIPFAGVYPVRFELRSKHGLVADANSHFVRLPVPSPSDIDPSHGRPVAVVLPVGGRGLPPSAAAELLSAHPDIPVTAIVGKPGIEALRSEPQIAGALVDALAGRPVVAAPTVDLDPSALAAVDHGHLFHQTQTGLRTELSAMGFAPSRGPVLLDAPLTGEGRAALASAGVELVLDPGRATDDWDAGTTDAGSLATIGLRPTAALDLGRNGAAYVLAGLVLDRTDGPTLLGPGHMATVDGEEPAVPVGAVDRLLSALAEPGAPPVVALDELTFPADGPTNGPSGPAVEQPQQNLAPVSELLVEAEKRLATYERFHREGGTEPSHYRHLILSSLDRKHSATERRDSLTSAGQRLEADMSVIEIPDSQPVNLAARSATIPLVVENEANGSRDVLLRFRSDKISTEDNGRIVTVGPGTSSIDVELEARSLGASPLQVAVMTPDGETTLATSRFEIRSTAVPGLGLLTSAGAFALLMAWWVLDAKKRRQRGETS